MLGLLSATAVGICSPGAVGQATPCVALRQFLVSTKGQQRRVQSSYVPARVDEVPNVEATLPTTPEHVCLGESAAEQKPVPAPIEEVTPSALFFCIATPNTSVVEVRRDSDFNSWWCSFAEHEHAQLPGKAEERIQQLVDHGDEGHADVRGSKESRAETSGSEKESHLTKERKADSSSLAHFVVDGTAACGCARTPPAWEGCQVRILGRSGKFYTIEVVCAGISGVATPRSIRRRYREFQSLDKQIRSRLSELPKLPPKSLFFRKHFKPSFLCKREEGLGAYVAALTTNPAAVEDAVVRHFLGFSNEADIHAEW